MQIGEAGFIQHFQCVVWFCYDTPVAGENKQFHGLIDDDRGKKDTGTYSNWDWGSFSKKRWP